MIDEELRRMFAEREVVVPPAAPLAARISAGLARRRHRIRTVRLTAGLAAVALLLVAVPVSAAYWRGVGPPGVGGTLTPSTMAATTTALPTTPADGLVSAPPAEVILAVTPGWLPAPFTEPTSNRAIMNNGIRAVGYQQNPRTSGVELVEITTYRTRPPRDVLGPDSPDDGVGGRDEGTVDIRGHRVTRNAWTLPEVDRRTCVLAWAERPDLWVVIQVDEKTRDMSRARAAECTIGRRVAEAIRPEPMPLARPVRLTLVPAGYRLWRTSERAEVWCPPTGDEWFESTCLTVQDGRDASLAAGERVSVNGHAGQLFRRPGMAQLWVPDYLSLRTATAPADGVADLSDEDIVRIAESAILPRPW